MAIQSRSNLSVFHIKISLTIAFEVEPSRTFKMGVAQSAAAKCAIWSARAFTKDGRAVARDKVRTGTMFRQVGIDRNIAGPHHGAVDLEGG
jgi:hypothetical protein